jgi:hypothetical protein
MSRLENQIKRIMEENDETTNDDSKLMCEVWRRHYDVMIHRSEDGTEWIRLENIEKRRFPTFADIQRIRSNIQNVQGILLPTDPKVREFRASHKKDHKSYMEYLDRLDKQYPN